MCFAWLGIEAVGLRLYILVNIPQLYHHLAPALLLFSSVKLKPNSPIVPIHAQVVPLVQVNLAESLYCVYTLMYLRICIFTFKLSLLNIQHIFCIWIPTITVSIKATKRLKGSMPPDCLMFLGVWTRTPLKRLYLGARHDDARTSAAVKSELHITVPGLEMIRVDQRWSATIRDDQRW